MSQLKARIERGQFVITSELVPPLSASGEKLLAEAALLGDRVAAINVTDAAGGRTAMSSFAAGAILAAHGYEPIVQVTCRDRNRIALAGDLIGAAAQGVRNVLVLRGDDPSTGDQPDAKPVFDLESAELMSLVRDMRDQGALPSGRRIEPPPELFIGGADLPREPDASWKPEFLLNKIAGGAGFLQTQFCFDLDLVSRYMARLQQEGIAQQVGVLVGVGPIRSAKSARWMNENLFGVHVPDAVIERLEGADDQAAEGRRICVELIEGLEAIPGVAGAHVMAPAQGTDAIASVLESVDA